MLKTAQFKLFISGIIFAFTALASAQSQPAEQTQQTSTTTLPSENTGTKAFSISFFSLGGFTDKQFRQADPSMDFFDNYISFNYKINRDLRISARPAFGYSTAGKNAFDQEVTDKIRVRDFSLVTKISNVLESHLPAEIDLSNSFRLYLPTSDSSRETGMIARLRYEIEAKNNFSKFSNFRYYAKPSYYFQKSTTFFDNSNPKRPNVVKTTNKIDLEHGAEFSFEMNKFFAAKPGFEIQEKWSNSADAYKKPETHTTSLRTAMGIEIRPNRDMNFTVAIQDTRDLIVTNKPAETGYTLMTNITMF